jgi:hypothetical protein
VPAEAKYGPGHHRARDLGPDYGLDETKYAESFGKHGLPALLAKLAAFQNDVGAETYSEGFALQTDDKGLFKG